LRDRPERRASAGGRQQPRRPGPRATAPAANPFRGNTLQLPPTESTQRHRTRYPSSQARSFRQASVIGGWRARRLRGCCGNPGHAQESPGGGSPVKEQDRRAEDERSATTANGRVRNELAWPASVSRSSRLPLSCHLTSRFARAGIPGSATSTLATVTWRPRSIALLVAQVAYHGGFRQHAKGSLVQVPKCGHRGSP